MLNNFDLIKSCFGPDDDDSEKFEIKGKKERKISYNPNAKSRKKREKKKFNIDKGYNSEGTKNKKKSPIITNEKKLSIDYTKYKLEKKKYDIEYDYGNVEYKLKLCDVDINRIEELTTQMKFRLEEGGGECYYEIGVEDNGNPLGISKEELEISVNVINTIANNLNSNVKISKLIQGQCGLIAELYIKKEEEVLRDKLEIKIGLLGEEGSGKSTIIGVLVSNLLDNGKGLARTNVFRHKHEIFSGKTSSISHQILGFDENGELTNYNSLEKPSWSQIVHKSYKIINFYDMAGTKGNFKKTTTSTLSNDYLDYLLLVISSVDGITNRTIEFLNFAFNMKLPIITVFTKIDLINDKQIKDLIALYKSTVMKLKIGLIPIIMKNNDDIVLFSRNIQEKNIMLTFLVSNLKWDGLNLFKSFLSTLPVNNKLEDELKQIEMEKMEFDIHEIISDNNKIILIGIVSKGKVKSKTKCYLGPDQEGNFKIVEIDNIHCKKIDVAYTYKGQYCSIVIKNQNNILKEEIKKGMVLLDINSRPVSSKIFEIELWTIDGNRRVIKSTYQPVLNIKHIRQGVKIKKFNDIFSFYNNPSEENELEILLKDNKINLKNVKGEIEKIQNKKKDFKKRLNGFKEKYMIGQEENDEFIISSTTKTRLIVEFMFNPEYINVGGNVIINDQSLKAFGIITKIFK